MRDMKTTLMKRDGITEAEAQVQVDEVRDHMNELLKEGDIAGAMDVCEDVGLEPDYLDDLI